MASGNSGLRCFISIPPHLVSGPIGDAVKQAVKQAGFIPSGSDFNEVNKLFARFLTENIATADCLIADLSSNSSMLFYELGLASAFGKNAFLIGQDPLVDSFAGSPVLHYTNSSAGLRDLTRALASELRRYRRFPKQPRSFLGSRTRPLFAVDWDRLNRDDFANLCLELLGQLGYKKLQWQTGSDIDIVAELPKKDPDGFEYRELWLIGLERPEILERYFNIAVHEPEYLLTRLIRRRRGSESLPGRDQQDQIILLSISLEQSRDQAELPFMEELATKRRYTSSSVRFRLWDRTYLTNLIYQFPPIGFKYFSDEGRSQSLYRKTPEQLYEENLDLNRRLSLEKDLRIRAQRDAVWKDISFSAAHKMGNPAFAIETNLDPLALRISSGRTSEALGVVDEIRVSIEKIKSIISQFKSLTNAQKINPIVLKIHPLLEESCQHITAIGAACDVACDSGLAVLADPIRLSECFDELTVNAVKWFDKPDRTMRISAEAAKSDELPDNLDASERYVKVVFADNGAGVAEDQKPKICDAFYTTSLHGTGLGLALVRRIIEGHGGMIDEVGVPGQGATFRMFLPGALLISESSPLSIDSEEVE